MVAVEKACRRAYTLNTIETNGHNKANK